MIELKDLLENEEVIVQYHLCNEYWLRNAITVKGSDDIAGALEMTLHRILEAGGTPKMYIELWVQLFQQKRNGRTWKNMTNI